MFKYQHIREEDYWLFPIVFLNIFSIMVAVYVTVLVVRGPALALAALGIWFTSSKIRNGYSIKRARFHIVATIFVGLFLAWLIYILTN